ncbi:hypothetical protein [Saccharothrix coeruleofusca]|uniref:AAA ATPase-like protein n=1 Tax=Saccharothrix coeruleofusca TaxID=33919 RepID=A0A918AND4_9PSEU|nr:hypothetical protein [Saccharothrix coeruleofusca]GGP60885.1 hypothetical protein GCM10010185_36710 [Saccharothrix coeruleofusca]
MAVAGLRKIEVRDFASIRSASVSPGRLNVLIGANGTGKSDFLRLFELLGRLAEGGGSDAGNWHFAGSGGEVRLHRSAEADAPGRFDAAPEVVDPPRGCRVHHFHDTSRNAPVRRGADFRQPGAAR